MVDRVLGSRVDAPTRYSPEILEPVERQRGDERLSPMLGADVWHLYELSWLSREGWPTAFVGALAIPASSPRTVESKSLKLYLNSLNFHRFDNERAAVSTIMRDVQAVVGASVDLTIAAPTELAQWTREPAGVCIDDVFSGALVAADWGASRKTPFSQGEDRVSETLISHQLRSLCPVTGQPDWGTLVVDYSGYRLDPAELLSFVCSFREHQDFHEHCVEQIYKKLFGDLSPEALTVTAYYQRRGGIDITPWRGHEKLDAPLWRMGRQ
ncbi:NADPH-dependent 7-cyano-7-deazaguanine reductase [Luminiphilus syltensis NOR5-1B]|uniref:NADPH-dependent 7-cyano-7-deazaguanine reductase n=1 Tax=Luminiphilus syltensis NOR5-1B TaxID=565045 RepID=B8KRQ4_9GAMM|nr:NADPH-dependent 7-cyano-7-deazaguanine reductase [Luminiphilus syltensis]EED35530.1 NADPH-dependent 7-cyano-7-deazaguanine reductase [Luminiphilus syltensis NOR5-1B]